VHTFNATLKTAGLQALFAADTVIPSVNGRQVSILVNPNVATHFVLSGAPSSVKSGTAFFLYGEAVDAYGNVATGYNGTVRFSSSDSRATLRANYTFATGGGNPQPLGMFTLRTKGTQTITTTDLNNPSIFITLTITVT
jgi:hypothetical protein